MSNGRNPNFYHLMLGLPPNLRQPNHYQLLDVDPFAADSETIRDAAARQNGKLMTWQNSKYFKQAGKLMLELAQARGVLLDPEKRQAYDQQLGLGSVDEDPVILLEAAPEEEPILLKPLDETSTSPPASSKREPRRRSSTNRAKAATPSRANERTLSWTIILGCLVGVMGLGALGWSAWNRNTGEPPTTTALNASQVEKTETDMPTPPQPATPDGPPDNQAANDTKPSIDQTAQVASKPPLAKSPFDAAAAAKHQADWANYLKVPVETTNSIAMKLRLVPPGEFQMGSPANEQHRSGNEQQHLVRITQPFYLGKYEVTYGESQQVMDENFLADYYKNEGFVNPRWAIEEMTWFDCIQFCNKLSEKEGLSPYYELKIESKDPKRGNILRGEVTVIGGTGYRLPTEAEWEWACRAGTTTATNLGDSITYADANVGIRTQDEDGNFITPSGTVHLVGSFKPNAYKLYDMHGNLREFCFDRYAADFYKHSAVEDPVCTTGNPPWNVVTRGGWYRARREDDCRSASRSSGHEGSTGGTGFRVCRSIAATGNVASASRSSSPALATLPFDATAATKHQTDWANYLEVPVETTNKIGMKLRLIPPGEFQMGSPPREIGRRFEEVLHPVKITKPFYAGVHEVTIKEFTAMLERTPPASLQAQMDKFGELPIVRITWFDAIHFCNRLSETEGLPPYYKLTPIAQSGEQIRDAKVGVLGGIGYRLPTEAEWEYACRAGTDTRTFLGESINCNHRAPNRSAPPPRTVDWFQPNPFGLYNVHGNAGEWCFDNYAPDYYRSSPVDDPVCTESPNGVRTTRVYRGGSHTHLAENCRSAARMATSPGEANSRRGIGLRVVRALEPEIF